MTVVVRPLREADVPAADAIMRLAFGTHLGIPDPQARFGDSGAIAFRFHSTPGRAFAAERDGELVGSCFAARWGSFGFFGPLTVHPDHWGAGIAQRLLDPVMDLFARWELRQAGLYTFADSAKHLALYRRFGFLPQALTAIMERAPDPGTGEPVVTTEDVALCRDIASAVLDGLDLTEEIVAVREQDAGATVLVDDGFAVCHAGAGEATSDTLYVKFGAVRPGPDAGERFDGLLAACERLAAQRGLTRVLAGVNLSRRDAWDRMLRRGYRTRQQGVIMQRPDEPGTCRPDAHVIDDLR